MARRPATAPVQGLTFVDAGSSNETEYERGGAVYGCGGRFEIASSRSSTTAARTRGPTAAVIDATLA